MSLHPRCDGRDTPPCRFARSMHLRALLCCFVLLIAGRAAMQQVESEEAAARCARTPLNSCPLAPACNPAAARRLLQQHGGYGAAAETYATATSQPRTRHSSFSSACLRYRDFACAQSGGSEAEQWQWCRCRAAVFYARQRQRQPFSCAYAVICEQR